VITVPAYFNDNQRQATKDAGSHRRPRGPAHLNEPTARALSYGYGKDLRQKVAIYDLGRRHLRRLDPRDRQGRLRSPPHRRYTYLAATTSTTA